jgi:hypothetical protein
MTILSCAIFGMGLSIAFASAAYSARMNKTAMQPCFQREPGSELCSNQ